MRVADRTTKVETVRDLGTLQALVKALLNARSPTRCDQHVRSNHLVLAIRHR